MTSAAAQAVIDYRKLWNDYVVKTLQALNTAADSFTTVAANPPSGYTAEQLSNMADAYRKLSTAYLGEWNQFAGMSIDDLGIQAPVVLPAFQDVVKRTGNVWTSDDKLFRSAAPSPPSAPSTEDQAKVQKEVDDSGALTKGIVGLLFQEKTGEVVDALSRVGSGILDPFKNIPWKPILVIGGAVVIMTTLGPVVASVAPLLMLRRH